MLMIWFALGIDLQFRNFGSNTFGRAWSRNCARRKSWRPPCSRSCSWSPRSPARTTSSTSCPPWGNIMDQPQSGRWHSLWWTGVYADRLWACPNRSRPAWSSWRTCTSSSISHRPRTCTMKSCLCSSRPSSPPLFKFKYKPARNCLAN